MIQLDMLGTLALRAADGREFQSVLAQPKRLAVLAYRSVESAHGPRPTAASMRSWSGA